jgi:hypothetical protein
MLVRAVALVSLVAAVALAASAGEAHARIVITGLSSWYGGPCDKEDNNRTASGVPNTVPGFATRSVPFGVWFLVTGPNGRRALGQSIERGPATWTGRVIDLNYTLAARLGYPAPGGCVQGYPNGRVRAEEIRIVRYPSCDWAAKLAAQRLRRIIGSLGRDDDCLKGSAAGWMRKFQGWIGHWRNRRTQSVGIDDWRVLLQAY